MKRLFSRFKLQFFFLIAVPFGMAAVTSCSEEETELGLDLQDPATVYNGICDTAYCNAYTVYDDSLLTSGLSNVLIGCYHDDVFGSSEAMLFTQVTSPNGEGVEFDQYCHIDSVILSLAVSDIFDGNGITKGYHNLHFEIYQLAEGLMKDSAYYAFDELPVSGRCFYNGIVRLAESDSMVVNLKLNSNFIDLIDNHSYATVEDFNEAVKGIRIRLVNDGTPQMITANLAASSSRLSAYYSYNNGGDSIYRFYEFDIGNKATHFSHFSNAYTGALATFNTNIADSLDGSRYLYLCPMGGTNVKLDFSAFVEQFTQAHPYAVIHYAELILPVADIAPSAKPDMIAALKCYLDGTSANIPDMFDAFTYDGFDGTYNEATNCFRLRVTQHLQRIVNSRQDLGTLLVINGRRSSAKHTVLNGSSRTATGDNAVRLQFVYSE